MRMFKHSTLLFTGCWYLCSGSAQHVNLFSFKLLCLQGKRKRTRSPTVTPPTSYDEENPLGSWQGGSSGSHGNTVDVPSGSERSGGLVEGTRVFAKWKTDYFPARVQSTVDGK